MEILRKIGLVASAVFLLIFLFSFGFALSSYPIYSTPERLKHALEDSGAYNTVTYDVLDSVQRNRDRDADWVNIPIDRPEVKTIIEQSASPEYLQGQAEGFLDSIYAWLRGDNKQLQFEIDLTETKANLVEGLAAYAAGRAAELPACTTNTHLVDPLNANCLPMGVTPEDAANEVRRELNAQLLEDPIITEEDGRNNQGESLEEQLRGVPEAYRGIALGLWVHGIITFLLAVAVVMLSRPWQRGLKRVGIIFVIVGASGALVTIMGAWGLDRAATSLAAEQNTAASTIKVLSSLANDYRTWALVYALITIALGVIMILAPRFIKPNIAASKPDVQAPEAKTSRHPSKRTKTTKTKGTRKTASH